MKFMRKSALILAIAPLVFAIAACSGDSDKQQIHPALQAVMQLHQQLGIAGIILKAVVS